MDDHTLQDDWVLAGRYRVDAPIGAGGMGAVWRGYDEQLDRHVAIKLMHEAAPAPVRPGTPESDALARAAALDRERFLREIRTTARLELPGVPAVYDFGTDPSSGRIYLVMQLLYGSTLAELIPSGDDAAERLPVSWAAAIAAQVAATLADVHRVDVVHRDLKPSNLIVSTTGLVKVLDFGVAILQGASALPKLTRVGLTVGSPPYLPPEQVLGNPVGPASDVYALGCVLFEMLTGQVPFEETHQRSCQDQQVKVPAPAVRSLRPDAPAELDALVAAMLAKQPSERPDAEQVYDVLLPMVRPGPAALPGELDPRQPFLRPLASAPRLRRAGPGSGARTSAGPLPSAASQPLTLDEAFEIYERAGQLLANADLRQAIDVLDEAVQQTVDHSELQLALTIQLATALYLADEFTRAAATFDALLPRLREGDETPLLRYYAGVSHAEIGELETAIEYLAAFLADADPRDPLYEDATFQLGALLPAVGNVVDGLRRLEALRPVLVDRYGVNSVQVSNLDRRTDRIRRTA